MDLSVAERTELETWARSRRLPAAHVKRARMLLLLDEGQAVRDFLTNSCY
ncbi:MAG TPA: hypothetical protein VGY99_00440 [Candidatus Binataceae bacterium]|nr:hypothetical protein [Candidatus Binataceae bacterium]